MRLPSILYPVEQAFRYLYGALPFSWRAGAQYRRLRRFLSEAQWWDAERIRQWQTERLGWMIRYAYENVPGYRHLYEKAGITPADFRTLDDLPAFPLLEKSFVQTDIRAFTSRSVFAAKFNIPYYRWLHRFARRFLPYQSESMDGRCLHACRLGMGRLDSGSKNTHASGMVSRDSEKIFLV